MDYRLHYILARTNDLKKSMRIIVMFLSAVWTFILTAPIHCRGSIGEQLI